MSSETHGVRAAVWSSTASSSSSSVLSIEDAFRVEPGLARSAVTSPSSSAITATTSLKRKRDEDDSAPDSGGARSPILTTSARAFELASSSIENGHGGSAAAAAASAAAESTIAGSVSWSSLSTADKIRESQITVSSDSSFLHVFDLMYDVWCNVSTDPHTNLSRLMMLYGRPRHAVLPTATVAASAASVPGNDDAKRSDDELDYELNLDTINERNEFYIDQLQRLTDLGRREGYLTPLMTDFMSTLTARNVLKQSAHGIANGKPVDGVMRADGTFDESEDALDKYNNRSIREGMLAQIKQNMQFSYRIMLLMVRVQDPNVIMSQGIGGIYHKDEDPTANDMNEDQLLQHLLLNIAKEHGYRRHGVDLYQEVHTRRGAGTRSWRRVMTLEEFLQMHSNRMRNYYVHYLMYKKRGTFRYVYSTLLYDMQDDRLPILKRARNTWSFQNGIYLADQRKFVKYNTIQYRQLPSDLCATKYIDLKMDIDEYERIKHENALVLDPAHEGWLIPNTKKNKEANSENGPWTTMKEYVAEYEAKSRAVPSSSSSSSSSDHANQQEECISQDRPVVGGGGAANIVRLPHPSTLRSAFGALAIPTPLDDIAVSQKWPKIVELWFWTMLGRMLYKLKLYDQWQVVWANYGIAGTGKSSAFEPLIRLFLPSDVHFMSNRISKQFGMATIKNRWIWCAPDINHQWGLDEMTFNRLVSGENDNPDDKGKSAIDIEYDQPGCMAFNRPPAFENKGGSFARRTVLFYFNQTVKVKQNGHSLSKRIGAHLSAILYKANEIYRDMTELFGDMTFASIPMFPTVMRRWRDLLDTQTSPLKRFLDDKKAIFEFDSKYRMLFVDFVNQYQSWYQELFHKRDSRGLDEVTYRSIFEERGLFDVDIADIDPLKKRKVVNKWVYGCCLVTDKDKADHQSAAYEVVR